MANAPYVAINGKSNSAAIPHLLVPSCEQGGAVHDCSMRLKPELAVREVRRLFNRYQHLGTKDLASSPAYYTTE